MKGGSILTIQELCWELNLSENTVRQKFPRTKENFLKKGILIEKHGKGDAADYIITKIDLENENEDKE